MPILHHYPLSPASRFVRLALGEMGEQVPLAEEAPGERREELLRINPAGTVPVLVDDDGVTVVGAQPIAEYLSETRGGRVGEPRLLPAKPAERAEVRRLVDWFLTKMDAEVTDYLVTEKVLKRRQSGGAPDAAAIRAARTNIRYHLSYVGYLTAHRSALAGRDISYADLAAAAAFSTADYLGEVPWEEDATAKAWYARMKSRPSFRALLSDSLRGIPAAPNYANLDF